MYFQFTLISSYANPLNKKLPAILYYIGYIQSISRI